MLRIHCQAVGKREYVQVLRLLETFEIDVVQGAISHAIDLGAIIGRQAMLASLRGGL